MCPQIYSGSKLPFLSDSPALLPGLAEIHAMFAASQDHRLVLRGRLLGWIYLFPLNCQPSLQYLENHPVILMEAGMGVLFMG